MLSFREILYSLRFINGEKILTFISFFWRSNMYIWFVQQKLIAVSSLPPPACCLPSFPASLPPSHLPGICFYACCLLEVEGSTIFLLHSPLYLLRQSFTKFWIHQSATQVSLASQFVSGILSQLWSVVKQMCPYICLAFIWVSGIQIPFVLFVGLYSKHLFIDKAASISSLCSSVPGEREPVFSKHGPRLNSHCSFFFNQYIFLMQTYFKDQPDVFWIVVTRCASVCCIPWCHLHDL